MSKVQGSAAEAWKSGDEFEYRDADQTEFTMTMRIDWFDADHVMCRSTRTGHAYRLDRACLTNGQMRKVANV